MPSDIRPLQGGRKDHHQWYQMPENSVCAASRALSCSRCWLSGSDVLKGRFPWPMWVTVVFLWLLTVTAVLYELIFGTTILLWGLGRLRTSRLKEWRVRVHHLLLMLLYGLITAWSIVLLMGHQAPGLYQSTVFVYLLWFWNATRLPPRADRTVAEQGLIPVS